MNAKETDCIHSNQMGQVFAAASNAISDGDIAGNNEHVEVVEVLERK